MKERIIVQDATPGEAWELVLSQRKSFPGKDYRIEPCCCADRCGTCGLVDVIELTTELDDVIPEPMEPPKKFNWARQNICSGWNQAIAEMRRRMLRYRQSRGE